jgi:hypothetical protein
LQNIKFFNLKHSQDYAAWGGHTTYTPQLHVFSLFRDAKGEEYVNITVFKEKLKNTGLVSS